MIKLFYGLLLSAIATQAFADSSSINLQLPSASGNYQYDKFRDGDLDCSNAIGSATNLEFGVTGVLDRQPEPLNGKSTDVGVYARIIIPLGKRVKQRVDCNRLYELAIREKQLEVMRLEAELKKLQEMQFEN